MRKPGFFQGLDSWLCRGALPIAWRVKAQQWVKEVHARLNGMKREKAEELNSLMCMRSMARLGFRDEDQPPFPPEVSIQSYLTATRIIKELGKTLNLDGSVTHRVFMADRGVAAFFAEEHFGGPEALLGALGYTLGSEDEEY